jgi:N-acetylneuraminic acid mutarotase
LAGNDRIVFLTGIAVLDAGYNIRFDIFNLNTNTWVVGQLPVDIADASIFSHGNSVYVVGGTVNGAPSGQVWRLVF